MTTHFRRAALAALASISIVAGTLSVTIIAANIAPAQAQVSAEFQAALAPYGSWQPHPRFGEVWVPYDLPPGWRPYTYGRWVFTDEWGWYWVSDDEEADWGWVTFHYGRWAFDPRLGWFWVPGDEWGPAWVDWRRGGDYVGWAPLPPDVVLYEYDDSPTYWTFVQPQYLIAPRPRVYFLPPQRTVIVFRQTVIVNRTVRIEHRDRVGRIAVNPGIAPGIVAAAARRPVQTFRVQPRVTAGTQGVAGAVQVRPQDLNRGGRGERGQPRQNGPSPVQAVVQPTQSVVQPLARVPQPEALRRGEGGRLGPTPPRAAQGATVAPPPAPKSPASQQPSGAARQPGATTPAPNVQQPPRSGPPATAPNTSGPVERQERREERREPAGAGNPPPQQNVAPRQPSTTTPAPNVQQPSRSGPPATAPNTSGPVERQERREERREPAGSPPQQPNIVRPVAPQGSPPPSPPPPRRAEPPSPPAAHPPPQRVQPPPPQPQRQVQPPQQPEHSGPPPKRPPSTPGERPNENR